MKYEQAFNTWQNSILQAGNEVSNALTGYQLAMKVRQFLPQMQSASSLPSYVFRLMSIAWALACLWPVALPSQWVMTSTSIRHIPRVSVLLCWAFKPTERYFFLKKRTLSDK